MLRSHFGSSQIGYGRRMSVLDSPEHLPLPCLCGDFLDLPPNLLPLEPPLLEQPLLEPPPLEQPELSEHDLEAGFLFLRPRREARTPAFTLTEDVHNMGMGHMALLRKHREGILKLRKQPKQKEYDGLAAAWDATVLRHGDTASDVKLEGPALHPNTYNMPGLMRIAFANVGATASTGTGGVEGTRRGLEAMMSAASMYHAEQSRLDAGVSTCLGSSQGVYVGRSHDATPCLVQFGRLQHVLEQHARYLVCKTDSRGVKTWKALPFDEYRKNFPRGAIRSGVVECLAQLGDVAWWEGRFEKARRYRFPPVFLQNTKSSTIHSAVDDAAPALSLDNLKKVSEKTPVIMDEPVDNGKSNVRRRAHVSAQTKECKNFLYQGRVGCVVHGLNRTITKAIGEKQTVGDIHAVQYVLRLASRRDALFRSAHMIVQSELEVVHGPPIQEHLAHSRVVLSHTMLRALEHVRGRLEDGWSLKGPASKSRLVAQEKLLLFVNGDIRQRRVTHYETGCCRDPDTGEFSRAICVSNVTAAIISAGLLGGVESVIPSKSRWGGQGIPNGGHVLRKKISSKQPSPWEELPRLFQGQTKHTRSGPTFVFGPT
jgi:hypothetical protein